jgi:hypothetical protein
MLIHLPLILLCAGAALALPIAERDKPQSSSSNSLVSKLKANSNQASVRGGKSLKIHKTSASSICLGLRALRR